MGRRPEYILVLQRTEYHVPPLSTLVQFFDDTCQTAWRFMQNRLADAVEIVG
jgi:hypothetical protein